MEQTHYRSTGGPASHPNSPEGTSSLRPSDWKHGFCPFLSNSTQSVYNYHGLPWSEFNPAVPTAVCAHLIGNAGLAPLWLVLG
ncbi:hypothetical protein O181_022217 [Austropuccinia psidii MF-1]|uniref:Uncharacterized protein n=1 Tax=Austropuccinia psidii MF-1 TaxID=1389203 RepID=A0A9Q3GWX7_9BASI|nr:hypothetical protein [Austropuccinia psidii MF-1]